MVSFQMTLKAELSSLSLILHIDFSGLITQLCAEVDFLLHQPELQLLLVLENSYVGIYS